MRAKSSATGWSAASRARRPRLRFERSRVATGRNAALTGAAPHIKLRDTMVTHKFAVGQTVRFSPDSGQEHAKGGLFKSFACSPKQGTCSNIALKARLTVTSASPEKINSPECKDRYANHRFEAYARSLRYQCGVGASICRAAAARNWRHGLSLRQLRLRNRVGDRTEATRSDGHGDLLGLRCRKRIPT